MKKIIVILSGGIDSTTVLYDAVDKGYEVEALSFNYGSKHNSKEIPLAVWHCHNLNIKHTIFDLPLAVYFKSSLLIGGEEIPEGHYEAENMKSTVVPFRNGILLSIAAGFAESVNAEEVWLGSHKGDHAIYPDCREEFTQAINKAIGLGTYNKIKIISPFNNLMKWDIVKRGIELNIDYSKTWSCYKGLDLHCGKCGTCIERIESFEKNNTNDITEYKKI